ncbi:MAG: penicillin acylase family protein, partial [Anaerolineae bacterium]
MNEKTRRYLPLALLTAAAAGLQLALRRFVQRPLPPLSGELKINGLRRPVEIIRDTWGVPHLYAENERDLFFAQGFVHAQDRLFQMDANRRVGAGRISEIVGPLGLPSDRFARFFGWTRAANAQLFRSDPDTRGMVDAYADGVNAFIAQKRLPVEFSVLAYRPEPWQAADTAAWGTVLAWGLSVNWETELMRARLLAHLGPEKLADFIPQYDDAYPTILPDAVVGADIAAAVQEAAADAAAYWPVKGSGVGSNNWVIGGGRTESGRPILANDPHLPPVFPTIWYENHLVGGRFNVTGFTMPGIPGVVIGHNQHIAWGVTNAFPDVQDVYVERFHPDDSTKFEVDGRFYDAEIVEETIKVRGRKPIVEKVRYTRHGPVFSDMMPEVDQDLSLRWSAYGRTNHMLALFNLNLAHGWDSFRDSLQCWGFPSQNIVYADVAGNIGYTMPGLAPRRRKGIGLLPTPGWLDDHEWAGWIP